MIRVEIMKMDQTGYHCANPDCKKLPEDLVNILGRVYHIKVDTTVAYVTMQGKGEHYCRSCIDELYKMLKMKLDSKLWAFH